MTAAVNLVKLCVGVESVDELRQWQEARAAQRAADGIDPRPRHITRAWPKQADALLDGGSLYWVFKGLILARQKVVALEEKIGEDGIRRCALILDPELIRTVPQPRRPFQGWRYLNGLDAPADLDDDTQTDNMPPELMAELAEIGVL
ncbi:DUF1489 family protein [Amaricoccus tamworthensis]|uniref:DUF1489 family protein n=1 Tax=Amaricoccus tamworthensis TaxID=57002 RepID=UPI003C7D40AC